MREEEEGEREGLYPLLCLLQNVTVSLYKESEEICLGAQRLL